MVAGSRERERVAGGVLACRYLMLCRDIGRRESTPTKSRSARLTNARVAGYEGPPEGWGRSMDPPKVRLTLLGGARAL